MRKEIYRSFNKENPIYIIGRGNVFVDKEVLNMNDTIIDMNTQRKFLIVGIEKHRYLMDSPVILSPYEYVLREY